MSGVEGGEVFRSVAMAADGMAWGKRRCPDTDKTRKTKQGGKRTRFLTAPCSYTASFSH